VILSLHSAKHVTYLNSFTASESKVPEKHSTQQ
jgi:hypothetical protein